MQHGGLPPRVLLPGLARCLSHSAELLPWSQCKEPPPWSQPTGSGRSVLRLSQSLLVDAVPLCIHTLSSLRSQAKRQQGQ